MPEGALEEVTQPGALLRAFLCISGCTLFGGAGRLGSGPSASIGPSPYRPPAGLPAHCSSPLLRRREQLLDAGLGRRPRAARPPRPGPACRQPLALPPSLPLPVVARQALRDGVYQHRPHGSLHTAALPKMCQSQWTARQPANPPATGREVSQRRPPPPSRQPGILPDGRRAPLPAPSSPAATCGCLRGRTRGSACVLRVAGPRFGRPRGVPPAARLNAIDVASERPGADNTV